MNKKTLYPMVILIVIPILMFLLRPIKDEREPITITVHASYETMSIDDLISKSDLIVIGSLNTIHASRWNTPDGRRPVEKITPDKIIFTDIDFNVTQFIKGKIQQENARIRSVGGTVEGDRVITDNVIPEKNKTYLLFLYLDTVGSTAKIVPGHYWIRGTGAQGLYEIIGGKAISASDEWNLDELIAYIQKSISTETLSPTLTPTPTELSTETLTPSPTLTPAELLIETITPLPVPTDLPTQTLLPTETTTPSP